MMHGDTDIKLKNVPNLAIYFVARHYKIWSVRLSNKNAEKSAYFHILRIIV